jgi:hypothetical protein
MQQRIMWRGPTVLWAGVLGGVFSGMGAAVFPQEVAAEEFEAHNIVHKCGVNMPTVLIEKCIVDIGRELLLKSLEEEKKPWAVLALDLCSEYFSDAICDYARDTMMEESRTGAGLSEWEVEGEREEQGQGQHELRPSEKIAPILFKLLGVPVCLSAASFAVCKISNRMEINEDYAWLATTQAFSLLLFTKNLIWQIGALSEKIDASARAKFTNTAFHIIMKYFPTVAGVAHFFHIDRALDIAPDDAEPPPSKRATVRDILKIISASSLFVGARVCRAFSCFHDSPWASVGAALLDLYCKGEFYKMLCSIKDHNFQYTTASPLNNDFTPLLTQVFSSLLVPLTVVSGIFWAKEFTLVSEVNAAVAQFVAYGLGVFGLWWNNVSLHKDSLEKRIVGYDVGPIHTFYSIVQKIIPIPDIAKIFSDIQKLVISIVYSKVLGGAEP